MQSLNWWANWWAKCRFGEHFASLYLNLAKVLYGHISEVVNEKWAYFYRNCQDWSIYATHHSSHLRWHWGCLSSFERVLAGISGLVEQLVARFDHTFRASWATCCEVDTGHLSELWHERVLQSVYEQMKERIGERTLELWGDLFVSVYGKRCKLVSELVSEKMCNHWIGERIGERNVGSASILRACIWI